MNMKIYDVESGEIVQVISTESRILLESYSKRFDGSVYAVSFCQDKGNLYETDNTQYIDLDNLILSVDDGIQEILIPGVYIQSRDCIKADQENWDDNDGEKFTEFTDDYYLTTDDGTSPEGFDSVLDCVFSVLGQ